MSIFASLLAAFIPMIIYLILLWRLDRYEREPFTKVFKHFLWGAIGAVLFALIFSTLLNSAAKFIFSSEGILSFISAVIVAPFAEEIVKSIYLFRSYKKNFFDNLTDGLVYGGAIGLGFGMTENLMYFTVYDETFSQWISIVITRSIFSAVMHAIATATVGAFLAKTKFTLTYSRNILPVLGLAIAMIFHAIWNFSLTFEFTYIIGIIFMIFLTLSFFAIFSSSLKDEERIITGELDSEYIIWKDRTDRISIKEWSKKFKKRSQRKRVLNFATKLAFRKLQAKNSQGLQKEFYLNDIDSLRDKIALIDKNNNV